MNVRVDEDENREGTSQVPDANQEGTSQATDIDEIFCPVIYDDIPNFFNEENKTFDFIGKNQHSTEMPTPLYDKTPNHIVEGNDIVDTIETIECSYWSCPSPIFDRTPDNALVGLPTFDKTPMEFDDPFDLSLKLHLSSSKSGEDPKEHVFNGKDTSLFVEEVSKDWEDGNAGNHERPQNVTLEDNRSIDTQSMHRKRTFLTPDEAKHGKSKYHHPSFYAHSIANTKRPCTCTIKNK